MKEKPKIVVIGAGFGGISLAKKIARKKADVLIIDKNNYHTFYPLLYQVATGGLEPDSIAYPVRRIFRNRDNVRFRMAEVYSVDIQNQIITTSTGDIRYDYLVIATGSANNFFSFDPVKHKMLSLKSIVDALDIRSNLMQNLEKAITILDNTQKERTINIAIIGGGPAGIEVAGALAEMKRFVLPKDYPEINFERMRISLFEANPELLSNMSDTASKASLKFLNELGVQVKLKAKVISYENNTICLEDGDEFPTDTVIWTAGVKGAPIEGIAADKITRGNRIKVNEFHQIEGLDNVFAIGDVAGQNSGKAGETLPMLASVAIQQGENLAGNLTKLINNQPMNSFEYKNKGVMATIGRKKAVADLRGYSFKGTLAWFLWMVVHMYSLVGFRNKIVTLIDWTQNYLSYDRPLGLIIRKYERRNQ